MKDWLKDEAEMNSKAEKAAKAMRNNKAYDILPAKERKKYQDIKNASLADYDKKVNAILSGKMIPAFTYEDGDQRFLSHDETVFLKVQTSRFLDYQPHAPAFMFPHLSDWLRIIWSGDDAMFTRYIDRADNVQSLIKRRETLMSINALFFVINGATFMLAENPQSCKSERAANPVRGDHMKIFDKLLELGADVNARDLAGDTPFQWIFHGLSGNGGPNNVTRKMAKKLLKHGADVDAFNRYGDSALSTCIVENRLEDISFLLELGADPCKENQTGEQTRRLAVMNPAVMKLFGAHQKRKAKEARKEMHSEAGGSFKKCQACQSYKKDTSRCTGCYLVWYCGSGCQKTDWNAHKADCKKTRAEFTPVTVELNYATGRDCLTGELYSNLGKVNKPSKSHFIVKIQRNPLDESTMMITNKDYSLIGILRASVSNTAVSVIRRKIADEGFRGQKGYFYATYIGKEGDGRLGRDGRLGNLEIKVNSARILPVENW